MEEKYLITGATGFVGAYLTRKLVQNNKIVYIVTRNKTLNWRLRDVAAKLHIIETDLLDSSLFNKINAIKPDYIFHLAAYGSLPKEDKLETLIDVNIQGTVNLINAVEQNPFTLFINTGSSSEYGIKTVPMRESDELEPVNDYAVTKIAATMYSKKEAIRNTLPIITFRLFSVFGPYEAKTRLFPDVIQHAINNTPIKVGSPANVRDFIYVDDVANAYIRATNSLFQPGDIFNIGSGKQHTVKEVVQEVIKAANSKSHVDWGVVPKQTRQIEPQKWEADITKSKEILKWNPSFSFESGIRNTVQWFRENRQFYE